MPQASVPRSPYQTAEGSSPRVQVRLRPQKSQQVDFQHSDLTSKQGRKQAPRLREQQAGAVNTASKNQICYSYLAAVTVVA